MFAIDDAKLPPPTPASAAAMSRVVYVTPGFSTTAVKMAGTSNISVLKMVQLRPPNFATAKV